MSEELLKVIPVINQQGSMSLFPDVPQGTENRKGMVTGDSNMNPKRLFVGNLTYSVDEKQLWGLFSRYGEVVGVRIIEGKGYGFVEMESYEDARAARNALNETEFQGRNLLIDDVRPPKARAGSPYRPGGKYQSKKPSSHGSFGKSGKKGSGEVRSRSSSGKAGGGSGRTRREEYTERVLQSAPRPYRDEKKPVAKKKPKAAVPAGGKPDQKKQKTRFWPGGRR
jgi:RNA recognition motif-containing protein